VHQEIARQLLGSDDGIRWDSQGPALLSDAGCYR
jgi:hypothetical protein